MSSSPVSNILQANLDDRTKLNIVCFFLDGHFEKMLVDTGHNIYGSDESFVSKNHICKGLKYLPSRSELIDTSIVFDLVLYNHVESQAAKAEAAHHAYHIPILGVQHFYLGEGVSSPFGHDMVFIDEVIANGFTEPGTIIPYGVKDPGESEQERDIDVLLHGKFIGNDYAVLKYVQEMQFKTEVWGDNPGVSEELTYEELTEKLKRTKVFINLSTHTGVPYSALLAMMCGCSILSNKNDITEHLFPSESAVFAEQVSEFAPLINKVLDGDWQTKGEKAREFALKKHDYDTSVKLWKEKLDAKAKEVYVR